MDVFEILIIFIGWVGSICAGYWAGFDKGYTYRKWEDDDD